MSHSPIPFEVSDIAPDHTPDGAVPISLHGELLYDLGTISNSMTVIEHGADSQFPRTPGAVTVYWIGSVEPSNATDNDLWIGGE